MFAILAEDDSDAETLGTIVRRHFNNPTLPLRRKGYDGGANLCRKGARDIRSWSEQGINWFIVCHDADSPDPRVARERVLERIVRPAMVETTSCITVPVQEIEAWIIADESAVSEVIPSFRFKGHPNPENIESPKEWLVRESKAANGKPLYASKTFNPKVAGYLRLEVVSKKCTSFRQFLDCLDAKRK